jgi:LysR family transcriptional regulator (chromosome initiation inhibitor)
MLIAHSQLPTFMAVAELSNLSAAARRLGVTQTGATQRIKSLEQSLGTALFTRSRSGMRLTEAGRFLWRYCTEVSHLEGQFLSGMKGAGHTREVDVCIVGPMSLLAGRVAPGCSDIVRKWPNVNLRFVIDSNANRLNQLKRGACDLAFVFPHEVGLELDSKRIWPVEYVLVGPSRWKSRLLKQVLEQEKLLAYHPDDPTGLDYLKTFDLLKHFKRSRFCVNENVTLIRLLELGLGFGVLPREIAEPLVKEGRLALLNQGRSYKIPFALAWYPRREMPEYFRHIVQTIT